MAAVGQFSISIQNPLTVGRREIMWQIIQLIIKHVFLIDAEIPYYSGRQFPNFPVQYLGFENQRLFKYMHLGRGKKPMLQSSLQLGIFQILTARWCQQCQDYLPSAHLLALVLASPQHLLPVLRSHCSSLGFGCHFLLLIQVSVPVLSATWVGLGFPCYPVFISWWGTCSYTFFSGSADLCLSSRHRCLWA